MVARPDMTSVFRAVIGTSIRGFHFGIAYEMGLIDIDKADKIYGDGKHVGYSALKNRNVIIKAGINF